MESPHTFSSDPHLCQPDGQKSCGWCCGLYNVRYSKRDTLLRKLRARTERFARTDRSLTAIQHFSDNTFKVEQSQRLDPDFYSCEFVGFLDTSENLVGCMLHPLAKGNGGIDWRGLSFHGTMACQGFFCRSFRELSRDQKKVILGTIQDWYLYGLVISDADYTKSFFSMTAERLGTQIDLTSLLTPRATKLVHEFFRWKINWPYKSRNSYLIDHRDSGLSAATQRVSRQDYLQQSLAPMDLIFKRLGSDFRSNGERKKGEQKVDQLFSRLRKVTEQPQALRNLQ